MPLLDKRAVWYEIMDEARNNCKNLYEAYYQAEVNFIKRYNHRAYCNQETGLRVYHQELLKRKG